MPIPISPATQNALRIAAASQPTGNVAEMVRGPLASPVAGRTDHLPVSTPKGSYVIPADVVSAIGEGNTNAGFKILSKTFPAAQAPPSGGAPIDILAAGGEFIVPPEDVVRLGQGNIAQGHAILDKWVKTVRSRYKSMLGRIPGPKR